MSERNRAGDRARFVPFELSWLGGPSERYFRRIRAGIDELPWGTLDPRRYPALLVDRARISWTEAAYNEYCTGLAFAEMLKALLIARAPIDLVGMASDFVADEILHIELTSRIAMELGGAAPYQIDPHASLPELRDELTPLQRACELVVRICCVGETFSVPMLSGSMQAASHPLTHQVLERIVKDEAPHGQFGWYFLDWAADELPDAERARLGEVALQALRAFSPLWRRLRSKVSDGKTSEGFLLAHVNELGWMDAESYGQRAREAVLDRIVAPLAEYGIELAKPDVDELLAE